MAAYDLYITASFEDFVKKRQTGAVKAGRFVAGSEVDPA